MEIMGVSGYQRVEDNFDIILSVEFGEAFAKQHQLISPTVFVTYGKDGEFKFGDICDEGFTADLELDEDELNQIHSYIEDHGLKAVLFKQTESEVTDEKTMERGENK